MQRTEYGVAAFLVERPRLKAKRIKIDVRAAAPHGLGFGAIHELGANVMTPLARVDPQKLDEHPVPVTVSDKPAEQRGGGIPSHDAHGQMIGLWHVAVAIVRRQTVEE